MSENEIEAVAGMETSAGVVLFAGVETIVLRQNGHEYCISAEADKYIDPGRVTTSGKVCYFEFTDTQGRRVIPPKKSIDVARLQRIEEAARELEEDYSHGDGFDFEMLLRALFKALKGGE